jgi:hypothetical protein
MNMSKKKNASTSLPALRIGSRIRCTDDGVTGRITWANAVAVKIKWDDGEQVTWKRDSLATRPIEILDADGPATEAAAETPAVQPELATPAVEQAAAPSAETSAETATPAGQDAGPTAGDADAPHAETPAETPAEVPAKPKRQRKPKAPAEPKAKKPSALDAAAKVLGEAGTAMTCKEMIDAMAAKGYWSSPGGKTPDATLCSAILREITVKGGESRFVKTAPGRFALRTTA